MPVKPAYLSIVPAPSPPPPSPVDDQLAVDPMLSIYYGFPPDPQDETQDNRNLPPTLSASILDRPDPGSVSMNSRNPSDAGQTILPKPSRGVFPRRGVSNPPPAARVTMTAVSTAEQKRRMVVLFLERRLQPSDSSSESGSESESSSSSSHSSSSGSYVSSSPALSASVPNPPTPLVSVLPPDPTLPPSPPADTDKPSNLRSLPERIIRPHVRYQGGVNAPRTSQQQRPTTRTSTSTASAARKANPRKLRSSMSRPSLPDHPQSKKRRRHKMTRVLWNVITDNGSVNFFVEPCDYCENHRLLCRMPDISQVEGTLLPTCSECKASRHRCSFADDVCYPALRVDAPKARLLVPAHKPPLLTEDHRTPPAPLRIVIPHHKITQSLVAPATELTTTRRRRRFGEPKRSKKRGKEVERIEGIKCSAALESMRELPVSTLTPDLGGAGPSSHVAAGHCTPPFDLPKIDNNGDIIMSPPFSFVPPLEIDADVTAVRTRSLPPTTVTVDSEYEEDLVVKMLLDDDTHYISKGNL